MVPYLLERYVIHLLVDILAQDDHLVAVDHVPTHHKQ